MSLKELSKDNLHHAYLLRGERGEMLSSILEFVKSIGIETENNPDFSVSEVDTLKVETARELRSLFAERGYGEEKKVFVISVNAILNDAQNTLLKVFEEPIENVIFFLIIPSETQLLKTLVSRFYVVDTERGVVNIKEAKKFLQMTQSMRIDFLKNFLAEEDEEEGEPTDSVRAKAIRFLNEVESVLHEEFKKNTQLSSSMEEILKARKHLRFVGSPTKTILESVALRIPKF